MVKKGDFKFIGISLLSFYGGFFARDEDELS